jgi:nicotinamidase/pyrazinamidase
MNGSLPEGPADRRKPAALLVVDVQLDFCPGGSLAVPNGNGILPPLNRHIAEALSTGLPIYASRDWHPSVTTHFAAYGGEWPPHCVQGSRGAVFHPDLKLPADVTVITKGDDPEQDGYSAFEGHTSSGKPFRDDLRDRKIEILYVAGLATDYCVRQTVMDGLRAGLEMVVLTDAVAGIDARQGDVDRALEEMQQAGAALETTLAHSRLRHPKRNSGETKS